MISYEPLWQTMKKRGVSTYALINRYGISSATVDRLKKGGGITTTKIDDFCRIFSCRVEDVIRYIPDDEKCPENRPETLDNSPPKGYNR